MSTRFWEVCQSIPNCTKMINCCRSRGHQGDCIPMPPLMEINEAEFKLGPPTQHFNFYPEPDPED